MKRDKILFYVATGLLTLMIGFSVIGFYFLQHDAVAEEFSALGYPTSLIYPYGILKLVGLVVLWLPRLGTLKEWAYSAFFFAFLLAFYAHVSVADGEQFGALLAIVLLLTSYFFHKRING